MLERREVKDRLFLQHQGPKRKTCEQHPEIEREIDWDKSAAITIREGTDKIVWTDCACCDQETRTKETSEWMHSMGVPVNMLHCSFETFRVRNDGDKTRLAKCKDYSKKLRGFLVIHGDKKGVGKTHLAVAVMRVARKGRFITNDMLMRKVSERYDDRNKIDIVAVCMRTPLLVIDDIGISRGGSDELPTLHQILTFRYGEKLPTILTTNLSKQELAAYVGERVADRLRECVADAVECDGNSMRKERRAQYLAG